MTFDLCTGWRRCAGAVDTLWRVAAEAQAHGIERIDGHVGSGGRHESKRCGAGKLAPRELQRIGAGQERCRENRD